jgi:hypothetical protein
MIKEHEKRIRGAGAQLTRRKTETQANPKAAAKANGTISRHLKNKKPLRRDVVAADVARKSKQAPGSVLQAKEKSITELQQLLDARSRQLQEAQKAQAELMRKERKLEDAKRELDLTVEKRVQASIEAIRRNARLEGQGNLKGPVTDTEKQLISMQMQIDELKENPKQDLHQIQVDVLELKDFLATKFPHDQIESVTRGEFGEEIIHRIVAQSGPTSGTILWESRKYKNWSAGWPVKLRDDQRNSKADLAVLVVDAMPESIEKFGYLDGVWVTRPRFVFPLAIALRQSLMEVANVWHAHEGEETRIELVYQYLTGPRFRQRVEAIVDILTEMQADLDRERKSLSRLWAKREAQIQGVIEATVGMYGDLQGFGGTTLKGIEALETPLLETQELEDESPQEEGRHN